MFFALTINLDRASTIFSNPTILVGFFLLLIILAFYLVLNLWRYWLRKEYKLPHELRQVILLVAVPKEALAPKGEEGDVRSVQEQIAWAENLWSSLGALKPPHGLKTWLYGRQDQISLEIVAQNKQIYFYVVAPKYLQQYLEQQIQAQYPHAQIEETDDYNIFVPQSQVAAAYLKLIKPDIFPIKTYRKMEVDPMNAVLNSLSQLREDEGAVVQLLVRPITSKWHSRGRKVVQKILSGKKMDEVIKGLGYEPWYEKAAVGALKGLGDLASTSKAGGAKEKPWSAQPQLSAMAQESIKSIEEKASKAGVGVNVRLVTSSPDASSAKINLDNLLNSFANYNIYEYGNGFKKVDFKKIDNIVTGLILRTFDQAQSYVLNTEELASVFHFPLPSCPTPNIHWLGARRAAAPVNMPTEGLILGKNIYRGKETIVRIKADDRRRHIYIIGMTGTGKSKLMVNMILQDIKNGEGVCYVDPHGEEAELIAANIPKERINDVIYFDPADTEMPIGLNMLEARTAEEKDFATQEMIAIFYKLVTDPQMIGPMFEHYMRNAMLLLMADNDDPGTIVEIPRIFTDDKFRAAKLSKCTDIMVKSFWEKEYAASQRGQTSADMLSYVISKVGRFVENEMMRNIIGQPKSGFNIREIMDNKKILLANLSKGRIGEVNSDLLGLIFVSKLQMAALSRAELPPSQRHDFYLYIDEFQNYVTDSIATILAEARKYRLNLNMAHQYIGQLVKNQNTAVKEAVFGNAGTMISFRIGVEDAEIMAKQYAPVFNEFDLMNIEKFNAYMRLLINNEAARPFNMAAFPPAQDNPAVVRAVLELSRQKYGRPRAQVEKEIFERSRLGEMGGEDQKTEMDMR